jgi:hypothetical protein
VLLSIGFEGTGGLAPTVFPTTLWRVHCAIKHTAAGLGHQEAWTRISDTAEPFRSGICVENFLSLILYYCLQCFGAVQYLECLQSERSSRKISMFRSMSRLGKLRGLFEYIRHQYFNTSGVTIDLLATTESGRLIGRCEVESHAVSHFFKWAVVNLLQCG